MTACVMNPKGYFERPELTEGNKASLRGMLRIVTVRVSATRTRWSVIDSFSNATVATGHGRTKTEARREASDALRRIKDSYGVSATANERFAL